MKIFRLYTERRDNLGDIVNRFYDGYTIIGCEGYWKGTNKNSAIIEIIVSDIGDTLAHERKKIAELAKAIKYENKQECVLVTEENLNSVIFM